ncbi:MAG: hypothetical protein HYV65_03285 [Candidatus Spechtbacteria bacterium]|nr:hypothetical protein [Candidatus Spechtbacteria bacterium]
MSKNAAGVVNFWPSDNQQETLQVSHHYYSGFFAAEMSCSVIKFRNKHPVGHYYMPDITVTNSDRVLLEDINRIVGEDDGVISKVKGALNLSFRGKRKVKIILSFLATYPLICGDLGNERIRIMRAAVSYLDQHKGHAEHRRKTIVMGVYRKALRRVKEEGRIKKSFSLLESSRDAVGYFLAGVIDGEGSFGWKRSNDRLEPYIAVAMKDEKIISLLKAFTGFGNTRKRKDGLRHWETNAKSTIIAFANIFLHQYPLRHITQRKKLDKLQRTLNDYMPKLSVRFRPENVI